MKQIKLFKPTVRATIGTILIFTAVQSAIRADSGEHEAALCLAILSVIWFLMYIILNFNNSFERFINLWSNFQSIRVIRPNSENIENLVKKIDEEINTKGK